MAKLGVATYKQQCLPTFYEIAVKVKGKIDSSLNIYVRTSLGLVHFIDTTTSLSRGGILLKVVFQPYLREEKHRHLLVKQQSPLSLPLFLMWNGMIQVQVHMYLL